MNIVIAMDSFKGSLSSLEAGKIIKDAILTVSPNEAIQVFPVADGGEGTVDSLSNGLNGRIMETVATGPLGEKINCRYGVIDHSHTAVIEMADIAGLTLVPKKKRNPLCTTTYGLGEIILEAISKNNCNNFIIGIGGSSTNDCGLGMLTALGIQFFDKDRNLVGIYGQDIKDVVSIDMAKLLASPVRNCTFRIACDVNNPLCGTNGCSAVYGPQKGATEVIVKDMDAAIYNFAELIKLQLGIDNVNLPGAGAAGGLGYAFSTFLSASLESGISTVLDSINLIPAIKTADIVITGEGCLDKQTVMGKAPIGVAKLAKKYNPSVKVIAFSGGATFEAQNINEHGIDAYFPVLHLPMDSETAMRFEIARQNLFQSVTQVFRLLLS